MEFAKWFYIFCFYGLPILVILLIIFFFVSAILGTTVGVFRWLMPHRKNSDEPSEKTETLSGESPGKSAQVIILAAFIVGLILILAGNPDKIKESLIAFAILAIFIKTLFRR